LVWGKENDLNLQDLLLLLRDLQFVRRRRRKKRLVDLLLKLHLDSHLSVVRVWRVGKKRERGMNVDMLDLLGEGVEV